MDRIRVNDTQKAQGLLEFALVLPILLMVIVGVFAFGHMFFAYTSIVSASREAARYGAVVGEGTGGVLRYQDCSGIRAAAERVGTFAGVTSVEPTDWDTAGYDGDAPGIFIGYDGGPDTTVYDVCPEGGFGPANVDLGDRILVRVSIAYEPIVPFLNLPSFPLTATTARTIVKGLPVGAAPTAEASCPSTAFAVNIDWYPAPPTTPWTPVVGQSIIPLVEVTASDGSSPNGTVEIYDADDPSRSCTFNAPTNVGLSPNPCASTFTYDVPGIYNLVIDYTPDPHPLADCYLAGAFIQQVEVVQADTVTEITGTQPISPSLVNDDVTVYFRVRADTPGGGLPTGTVQVLAFAGQNNFTCDTRQLDDAGDGIWVTGACQLRRMRPAETYTITAKYLGDASYNGSDSSPVPHVVTVLPTPTPIVGETPEPGETPTDPSIPPDQCPSFATLGNGLQVAFPADRLTQFYVNVVNPNFFAYDLKEVSIRWPDVPTSLLMSTYFDSPTAQTNPCAAQGASCLWIAQNTNSYLNPLSPQPLSPTGPRQWDSSLDFINTNQTKQMLFTFTANLPSSGTYSLRLTFARADGQTCVLSLNHNR